MINKNTVAATILMFSTLAIASEGTSFFSGKKIAIKYEDGKAPTNYYNKIFEISKEFVASGEILSSEIVKEGEREGLVKVLVKSDSFWKALEERKLLMDHIGERFAEKNNKLTNKLFSFPENKFFGDKRIGYITNMHESCFYEGFLVKGLTENGAEIVAVNQEPDIIITVGVDTCLTNSELNKYLRKKSPNGIPLAGINKAAGIPNETQKPYTKSTIGNDLIRSGSSTNLALGNDSVGLALMGAGVAFSIIDSFSDSKDTKSDLVVDWNKEIDLVRYHITLEGKDKEPVSFYSTYTGTTQHEKYSFIAVDTFVNPTRMLYRHIQNWANDSKVMKSSLQPHQTEPDLHKSLNMLIMGKSYVDKDISAVGRSNDKSSTTEKADILTSKNKQKIKK